MLRTGDQLEGELLVAQGLSAAEVEESLRQDEARRLLQPAHESFSEGFETADLRDAAAVLAQL